MSQSKKPLLKEAIPTSTTRYVGVPISHNKIGLTIGWKDAIAAATITLELTDFPYEDVDHDEDVSSAKQWTWQDSGETIVGPTATAADGTLVQIANVNHDRARLKIVTTAVSDMEIHKSVGLGD